MGLKTLAEFISISCQNRLSNIIYFFSICFVSLLGFYFGLGFCSFQNSFFKAFFLFTNVDDKGLYSEEETLL